MTRAWLLPGLLLAAASGEGPPGDGYSYRVPASRSALEHFAEVAVKEKRVPPAAGLVRGLQPRLASAAALLEVAAGHHRRLCSEDSPAYTLHSAAYDANDVQHAVLQHGEGGRWQYIALQGERGERLLAADPPLCTSRPAAGAAEARRLQHLDNAALAARAATPGSFMADDPMQLLHPTDDSLVRDCVAAFHTVSRKTCNRGFSLEVLSATVAVISGFKVRLDALVSDGHGEAQHTIDCLFLEPQSDVEAQRLRELPELPTARGLSYTIRMSLPLCQACQPTGSRAWPLRLYDRHSFGELSLYRGWRHVYDDLPQFFNSSRGKHAERRLAQVPANLDLRQRSPSCFPAQRGGTSSVQDQGGCGSCWAFASATCMMANMCMASGGGADSMASAWQRYEVSPQHIMTCNPEGMGCEGGHAQAAKDNFEDHGVARLREHPYRCHGGGTANYFSMKTGDCQGPPWGGNPNTCPAVNPRWHFEGLYQVNGGQQMMEALALGYVLFSTIMVPRSLVGFRGGRVYGPRESGSLIGGHAIVVVGYGLHYGQEYWLVQNSWGTRFGDEGFYKHARGVGYLGIEDTSLVFRGYTEGHEGSMPPTIGLPLHGSFFSLPGLKRMFHFDGQGLTTENVAGLGAVLALASLVGCLLWACCCRGRRSAPPGPYYPQTGQLYPQSGQLYPQSGQFYPQNPQYQGLLW